MSRTRPAMQEKKKTRTSPLLPLVSESASESEQNGPPSSLASDAEQYERMQASYTAVRRDFKDQEAFIGSEYHKLQRLELVPQRWPLARLSISLQKCVDHRAKKLQVSVFLPNDLPLDEWCAGVYALPTVWPDVSMLGASNLRRVVGYDFHHIRKKYDVPSMWGNIHPQWRLLQQHLETKGPGWYPLAEREERLFTNRSNRLGDDMKDELRTDSDPTAWRIWSTSQNQLWQLRQPAPLLEFPGEQGMLTNMYAQVREEEQVISLQFICSQQDVSKSRRRKRKQVDDGTAIV